MENIHIEYVTETLARAVEKRNGDDRKRLEHSLAIRRNIQAAIQAGQTVMHPRMVWAHATGQAIVKLLGDQAQAYDKANPDDKASFADMLDVVESVRQYLVNLQVQSGEAALFAAAQPSTKPEDG